MGISNNSPTMSYIHISGISVVWNNETYMVQDFATNKKYIYWNADTPHQLNASNVMPNRSTKQYLVIVNDNGMHSLVPSTSEDFSISFEGNSNQAIKDRIFGLYEKNEEFGDKFVTIEQDIDGIRSIVGETDETIDGTLIDRISNIEQRADEINLSVEEVSKKYNDDKETNELRENLNSSIIKLNSTLGTFKSELTDYFKNNEVSSEEQVKIKTQLEILKNNKIILEGYVNTVRLIAESNNQTQDVVALDSAKKSLQIAHDNLHNNVTNAIIDNIITPTENTIIIDSFAKYNLKINELKNTCDDIIFLGVGGVITEELANISIKSNEINLSVSKKVDSNSIISAINLSPESIKISSSKINITGFVTFSDLSTPGSTTISGSNITTGYVKGNRIDAKNLTVQTDSGINTLMIDSNGQVELRPKSMTVNTDDKITFLASNNYRNMLLYGGQVCVYNNMNDSFMATIGHVLRSSNSTYRGVGVLAGKGCNTFFIGRDSTWGDILTNRSPNPLGSLFINFESITAQTDGVKGIHLRDITYTNSDLVAIGSTRPNISGFNSIQATSGVFDNWKCAYNEATIMRYDVNTNMINLGKNLNVNGFSISGAARVESPKVYMDSLYALNGNYGKQLLRTNGWDMFNGVNWDWQGYNILSANLIGCSVSYSLLNTTNQLVDVESSKIKLACEDISKIDENGEVIFDISDMLHLLYDRITKLEEENKELRNLI